MSSLEKEKQTTKLESSSNPSFPDESDLNPLIPDDLMFSCITRLSRLYYPIISLVSKSFPSLLASSELYESRSRLNRTESCLYVLLRTPTNTRWFTLCKKPNRILTNDDTREKTTSIGGHQLVPIPNLQSPPLHSLKFVSVGFEIYSLGGMTIDDHIFTSSVSVLDCRSHTWREAPSMRFKRCNLIASVFEGNIYVVNNDVYSPESREYRSPDESFEVFDIKTQTWDIVPCLSISENEGKWNLVKREMDNIKEWKNNPYCVIDNVFYAYDEDDDNEEDGDDEKEEDRFVWYDYEVSLWKRLKGLVGLPKFPCYGANPRAKLVEYGGKLAVLWWDENKIWCAVISIEKRVEEGEIWGRIEWFDCVLTDSGSCHLLEALTVTL